MAGNLPLKFGKIGLCNSLNSPEYDTRIYLVLKLKSILQKKIKSLTPVNNKYSINLLFMHHKIVYFYVSMADNAPC